MKHTYVKTLFLRKMIDYQEKYGDYFSLKKLCDYYGVRRQTLDKGFSKESTIETYRNKLGSITLKELKEYNESLYIYKNK